MFEPETVDLVVALQAGQDEIARLRAENERLKIALTLSQKHFSQQRDAAEKADEQCAVLEVSLVDKKIQLENAYAEMRRDKEFAVNARREERERCVKIVESRLWSGPALIAALEAENERLLAGDK